MNSFTLDPLYLTIGVPALALGLILGVVIEIGRAHV